MLEEKETGVAAASHVVGRHLCLCMWEQETRTAENFQERDSTYNPEWG